MKLRGYQAAICCLLFSTALVKAQPASVSAVEDKAELAGVVKDSTGAFVPQAVVTLLNARQSAVASAITDERGQFVLRGAPAGTYELRVTSGRGFAAVSKAVRIPFKPGNEPGGENSRIEITLGVESLSADVTITADIGVVQSPAETTQQVNVIDERKLRERAKSVLAQAAQEEPGLQLQRTSATMGAIFVRGVTGAKVVNYVDGIRFSTATARGGVNTFFNLNDASGLRAVEVIRGPNSAQFGSDSIGGSVQLISRTPLFSGDGGTEIHGQISSHYNSADHGFGGNSLATFGARNLAVLVNLASHRSNTLRSGGGFDSHAAVTRFLGIRSDIFGERSTDTAFTQYGGMLKLNYRLTDRDQLSFHYQRSQIDGGVRFDQTLGGDGNLIADLRNFMLDFFYGRYERFGAGLFDALTLSYSYNAQREERVNQGGNGNPLGAITHQYERTAVNGFQAQAAKQWPRNNLVIGGEFYYDRVRAPSFIFNPSNGSVAPARPRVPDKATYRNGGVYVQNVWTAVPDRLRLIGALRYGRASYLSRAANSPLVNGQPLWPDDQLTADAVTPRFGAVVTLIEGFTASVQVSRGFRTPHITDLGTLGLTGNGFEANAADLAGSGATIGSTAGSDATSTGIPVAQLRPETSWTYEGGLHLHRGRVDVDVNGFVNDIYDNIVLQTLILPQGATGSRLGDQIIISQNSAGAVFVPAATNPVLIRSNFGDARIYGVEQKFDLKISKNWTAGQNFTWLRAEDRRTGLPPTIEGGTPAPQGWLRVRYASPKGRFWIEPYLYGARRQDRLSTLDLDDRRTGAARSRSSIANFFSRGARARGLISPGADGRFGSADDLLQPTGETLAQVQDRVLGPGVNSAPLFTYIPGFLTGGIRGGFRIGEKHDVTIDLENINDKNYRGISWGMDAPGRGLGFRYNYQF